ncbi:MAG: threonine-phosphate decarboxylase, partial [Microvirga sp.]|nr:threonine-phosphate decarboxylase [Microvirga sp.]
MNHGGNLHDAKALFPEAPEPWIDLSTGINPNAYPVSLNDPAAFTRLPSQQTIRELEQAAARTYGVPDPHLIVAAPGSQSLIELLPRLRPKGRVAIIGPTYNEHAACWMGQGHECIDVATLSDALSERPDIIVLVNPNNPDGRVVAAPELASAATIMHARDGWLVVDEAFADLEDGVSIAHRDLPGTIILRSFGKTYGLAGIRLGFAIAARPIVDEIRAQLGLWAISGPALAIGIA